MEGRVVSKDVAKVVYHGALTAAFTKIGCDAINFGVEQFFSPETNFGEKSVGLAVAACGAANITAACKEADKTIKAGKQLIIDISSLDEPDDYDDEEPIDVDV